LTSHRTPSKPWNRSSFCCLPLPAALADRHTLLCSDIHTLLLILLREQYVQDMGVIKDHFPLKASFWFSSTDSYSSMYSFLASVRSAVNFALSALCRSLTGCRIASMVNMRRGDPRPPPPPLAQLAVSDSFRTCVLLSFVLTNELAALAWHA